MSRKRRNGSSHRTPSASRKQAPREPAFVPLIAEQVAEDIDHVDLTRIVWQKKWFILAITLVLTGAAAALVFSLPRHYVAEALVVIDNRDGMTSYIANNGASVPITKPDPETVRTEIEMLQSPALAAQVVRDLHLQERPEFNPYLSASTEIQGAPGSRTDIVAWLKNLATSAMPSLAEKTGIQDVAPGIQLNKTIDNFLAQLQVAPKGQSRVVSVEFGSGDPQVAANAINSLLDHYIGNQITARSQSAEETMQWLDRKTAELRTRAETAEKAVEDFRSSQQLYSGPGGTPLVTAQLADLTAELARAQAVTAGLEAPGRRAGEPRAGVGTGSSPLLLTLQTQEADIERQLAASSADLGDRNPVILQLRASLRELRGKIAGERSKLAGSAAGSRESRLRAARATEQALKDRLAKVKQDASRTGVAGVTLHALEREAAADRIVLENFLARSVEMAHAGNASARHLDAQIVSRASVPINPDKPKRTMLTIIAAACSLVFGIALAIFLEKRRQGYRSLEEIEAITRVSGFGLVPIVGAARTSPLTVARNAGSSYYAAIRSIWTTLSLLLNKKSKVIMVTSALPQEGKTTLALSMAAMAGHGGRRTVLVDVDFWRGTASAALGLGGGNSGFAELLDGKISLQDVIVSDIGAGIDIIRPGTLPRGYDLTMRDKLLRLMQQLATQYEYIIIDSPPVLAISEMLFLAAFADVTILAVRWNHTPRGAANLALRKLREAGSPVQGTVLTMVDEREHARSGRAEAAYFSKDIMDYYAHSTRRPYPSLAIRGPEPEVSDVKRQGVGTSMRSVARYLGHQALIETRIQPSDHPKWALLVIDVQEDLISRSGRSGLDDATLPKFLDTINRVSEAARSHGALVIYTRQECNTLGGKLASRLFFHSAGARTPDNRIHPGLNQLSDHQFSKSKWNAFSSSEFDKFLRTNNIDNLCLLGLDGLGSIADTARSAIERGYRVTFINDCIATPFKREWEQLLADFEDDHAFSVTSQQFLDRLNARFPAESTIDDRLPLIVRNDQRFDRSGRDKVETRS